MSKEKLVAQKSKVRSCATAYKRVFNSPDGQLILQDLMRGHGFVKSQFSKDPYENAFMHGQRFVVERILGLLKLDLEALDKKIETALRKDPFWVDSQDGQ